MAHNNEGVLKPVTPVLLAATVIPMAAGDCEILHGKLAEFVGESDVVWIALLQELFRAHFCLASLRIVQHFQSTELRNSYCSKMLEFLAGDYPDEHSDLVQRTFSDATLMDDATRCYVRGNLTNAERHAVDDLRRLTGTASGDKGLVFFCERAQIRLAKILSVTKWDPAFLVLWGMMCGGIPNAWKTVYGRFEPIFIDAELSPKQQNS
jgi:hypothetical protein